MPTYQLTPEAKDDFDRIFSYGIDTFGVKQAIAYSLALERHFEKIAEQPYLYQAANEFRQGYRKSVCGVDTIYYRVLGDLVEIMAIIGRQDHHGWVVDE